ncbi:hypothetical protein BN1708_020316, partial [Verticillium longisporum]
KTEIDDKADEPHHHQQPVAPTGRQHRLVRALLLHIQPSHRPAEGERRAHGPFLQL